jgi:hypothetical protein
MQATPAYWQQQPEEYLGMDDDGRDYWLYRGNVYRTTRTGTRMQSTTWLSCAHPFEATGRKRYKVRRP